MRYTTEAYVVHEPGGPIKLETIHYSDLRERELLIDAVAVSMCHTDIRAAQGGFFLQPPMILGHESAGFVREVGSGVTTLKPGDPVILSYASCGICPSCHSGRNAYCDDIRQLNFSGRRLDGSAAATDVNGKALHSHFFGQSSMSRLILAHEMNAVKVDASREELKSFAALGCGIQTGAGGILNVLKPPTHSSIAIFGGGAVGLAALFAASLTNPSHLVLIDNSAAKLSIVPPGHATQLINSSTLPEGAVAAKMHDLTNGRGFDYVIDAVGSGVLLKEGHLALAAGGTLLTLGGNSQPPQFPIEQHLVKGITYRGTHQGDSVPRVMIPFMIELWRKNKFPFDKLLTFFPFTDLHRAIDETKEGKVIKPVLVM